MRIGIDACCWSNRRGFGRFTRELLTALMPRCTAHEVHLVVDRQTAAACTLPSEADVCVVDTGEQPTRAASATGARSFTDLWRMRRAVARLRPDVFLFPAVYSFFPLPAGIPTAVVLHDVIAERHPDLVFPGPRSRLFWNMKVRLALRQATLLATVSEHARTQIARTFHLSEPGIRIITEGPAAIFRPMPRLPTRPVLERHRLPSDRPLLLYVGGISPHKNLDGLFRGLARLRRTHEGAWHAAIVGDHVDDSFHSCHRELMEERRRLDLEGQVTFTGYVSNEDLVALYNAATMLVAPAFMEGFGLPVVEAMACGLPVAASTGGSLPEVVGSAGLLFDPEDPIQMAAVLGRLLHDPDLRARLGQEGVTRSGRYSWEAAATQTLRLLEDLTP